MDNEIDKKETTKEKGFTLLVHVLENHIPGCETFSHCIGHVGDERVPETDWSIDLEIDQRKAGWKALERIADAIWAIGKFDDIVFTPWPNGPHMMWNIRGYRNVDPELLAVAIIEGWSTEDDENDSEEGCGDPNCTNCYPKEVEDTPENNPLLNTLLKNFKKTD